MNSSGLDFFRTRVGVALADGDSSLSLSPTGIRTHKITPLCDGEIGEMFKLHFFCATYVWVLPSPMKHLDRRIRTMSRGDYIQKYTERRVG